MIKKAADGDSHKPPYHWSFCQSPDTSMVPGFVLMPLVTSRLRAKAIPFRRLPICTTWAAAHGEFKSR
jgi:hypothetical protein